MLPYLAVSLLTLFLSDLKYEGNYLLRWAALIPIVLFVGLRYDVGADYLSYEVIFRRVSIPGGQILVEPGYLYLNKLVLLFTDRFFWLTTTIVIIQVVCLHFALKDFEYYTFGLFVFITMNLGSLVNEMRQYLAIALFLYSIRFIINRSLGKYLICILIGASFHYSLVLITPIYFILSKKLQPYVYPLLFVFILAISKTGIFDKLFGYIIQISPYAYYLDMDESSKVHTASGLGFLIKNILGFIILLCYKPILEKYPKYTVYLNLYFAFLIARNLFFNIGILMRLTLYFQIAEIIVYPLFVYALFKKELIPEVVIFISALLLTLFLMGINNPDNHLKYQLVNLW
jgi:transmembrane protein EpsG